MKIKFAGSDDEILSCFDVVVQLHEKLEKDVFVQYVRRFERTGYKLVSLGSV